MAARICPAASIARAWLSCRISNGYSMDTPQIWHGILKLPHPVSQNPLADTSHSVCPRLFSFGGWYVAVRCAHIAAASTEVEMSGALAAGSHWNDKLRSRRRKTTVSTQLGSTEATYNAVALTKKKRANKRTGRNTRSMTLQGNGCMPCVALSDGF